MLLTYDGLLGGRKIYLLEDKQISSAGVFDEHLDERGDGIAITKRRRQDFQSDVVMDLVTASGRALPRELQNFLLKSNDNRITNSYLN
ncbi:hypothetical protein Tco_1232975, partial [Tanacetum coccineum]